MQYEDECEVVVMIAQETDTNVLSMLYCTILLLGRILLYCQMSWVILSVVFLLAPCQVFRSDTFYCAGGARQTTEKETISAPFRLSSGDRISRSIRNSNYRAQQYSQCAQ